jgi:hypothetical protein
MDRYKIHKVVEYIRTQPEFPFDGVDVEESLDEVLAYFGLHPQFDDEERQVLREELRPLAWSAEEAEIALLAEETRLVGLMHPSDRKHEEKSERCAPEGGPLPFSLSLTVAGPEGARQGVSPFSGENAP